ncbi:MAG: zinc ribbon domain-containing protein [Promethearchaeota archaeon]
MQWRFFPLFIGIIVTVILVASIIAIVLCIWIYRDAEAREENGALWVIILLISGIIGLIIWLIVRSDKPIVNPRTKASTYRSASYESMPTTPMTKTPPAGTKFCKACGKSIPPNSVFCPNCGTRLG